MSRRCILLLIFALLALIPYSARADGVETTLAGRRTVYWVPEDTDAGRRPLILFSHGLFGCSTQSKFLTEALANAGYWVFAPDHDDAICKRGIIGALENTQKSIKQPEDWDDTTYSDRADNLNDLLDALKHDAQFKDRIDFSRIGLMGHSLGGYTVMGLAGAWPQWKMKGVKAVLALSPYSQPFIIQHTLGNISVPIMFQGGTRDFGITPMIKKNSGAYEGAPPPKYFVDFQGANHFAWTDLSHQYRNSIIAYSVAFFDHYVKGLPASPDLTAKRDDVSQLWYDSELGKKYPENAGKSAP